MTTTNTKFNGHTNVHSLSDIDLLHFGVQAEGNAKAAALECIARCARADSTITVWLQDTVRAAYPIVLNDSSHILWKGYQSWKGTSFHAEYRFVNRVQARANQLKKAAKDAAAAATAATTAATTGQTIEATPTDNEAAKLAAESVARKVTDELADVKENVREKGIEIAELQAQLESLKKQLEGKNNFIARLEREKAADAQVFDQLAAAIRDTKVTRKDLIQLVG